MIYLYIIRIDHIWFRNPNCFVSGDLRALDWLPLWSPPLTRREEISAHHGEGEDDDLWRWTDQKILPGTYSGDLADNYDGTAGGQVSLCINSSMNFKYIHKALLLDDC